MNVPHSIVPTFLKDSISIHLEKMYGINAVLGHLLYNFLRNILYNMTALCLYSYYYYHLNILKNELLAFKQIT